MLKNYFKIALRNILRHKAYSILNISGLAIGMARSILILLWVQNELSYDRSNTNADQLYRLTYTFMAEQRTKEIGVRKVLGASVFNIVYLLSGSFTKLIIIAMAVAIPVSWFAINSWLKSFAYRIDISWIIFLVASGTSLLIAWFTVSYESVKAAVANPVKSLRME